MITYRNGLVILWLCITSVVAIAQTTINLNAPDAGRKEYVASEEITLEPNYEFTAGTNDFMWGYIDDRLPGQTSYSALYSESDFDNRAIDETLDVGYTPGQHGVSPTGGATYTIPIQIPTGTNGFVPSLSVNYNSQAGNGLLGMGWNLAATSIISRVGKTIYHNGKTEAVQMDNSDVFVMDGQRFFPLSGNNGANNTVYGFENENYSRVTSYGQSGNGPEWFKVETKNGITMEFGNSFRSTLPEAGNTILMWGLTKMYDQHGNYIEYLYKTDNYQLRLHEIRYTGNSAEGVLPYNKIKFYYNTRTDKNSSFLATNTRYNSNYLLDKIVVESDGSIYRNYEFKYGKTDFSFLNSVQEVASDGSKLNSTIFRYNVRADVLSETETILNIKYQDLIFADFDGDGVDDALQMIKTGQSAQKSVQGWTPYIYYYSGYKLYINNGATFQHTSTVNFGNDQISPSELEEQRASNNPMLGDFNGDGLIDFLTLNITKIGDDYSPVNLNIYLANGNGFNAPIVKSLSTLYNNTWNSNISSYVQSSQYLAYEPGGSLLSDWVYRPSNELQKTIANPSQFLTIGDFNGDGISDIIINYLQSGKYLISGYDTKNNSNDLPVWQFGFTSQHSNVCYNIASSSEVYSALVESNNSKSFSQNSRIFSLHFDSDFKDEIAVIEDNNTTIYNINGAVLTNAYSAGYPQGTHEFRTGDFNGDQKTDFLLYNGTNWVVAVGSGAGWNESIFMSGSSNPTNESVLVADINGDGLSDIVHGREENGSPTLNVHYSLGNTFKKEAHFLSDGFSNNFMTLIPLDFDGDGRQELAKTIDINDDTRILNLSSNEDYALAEVKDGFNKVLSFEYSNITNDNIYEENPISIGGTKTIQNSLQVVKKIIEDNGVGGNNSITYQYGDLMVNRLGVGFLGFGKTTVKNEVQNTRTETTNELSANTNHIALLPSLLQIYLDASDELITSAQSTFDVSPRGSHRWELKLISSVEIDHINRWKTTKTNLAFDNYGNVEESHTSIDYLSSGAMIESVHSITSFVDDSYGLSIPYLPSTITVERKRNGEAPYSRTSTNTYTSKGDLLTSVNDLGVTKTYGYDAFGHVISTSISSASLPTITNSSVFDNKGRYLTSSTNSLGQTTTYSYYPTLDKIKQTIGITGLTTKYDYDKWGFLTKTTSPNGRTVTVSKEFDINTSAYNQSSDPSLSFSIFSIKSVPSDGFESVVWYDIIGREVQEMTEHPSGSDLIRNTAYNEMGKLHKVTEPHFVGGSAVNVMQYHYNDPYFRITLVSNSQFSSTFTYDNSGSSSKTTETHSSGQTKSQSIDATAKVVKSEDSGGELTHEYFSNGLIKSTQLSGNNLVSIEYDDYGRRTKLTDVSAGVTQYAYNAYNQLVTQTDANGNITTFTYDNKGDIASEAISGMSGTTVYEYYTTGGGLNKLKKVTAPNNFSTEFEYDGFGRPSKMNETTGAEVLETKYEYNSKGENTAIIYPSGHKIEYEYIDGVMSKVKDANSTIFSNAVIDKFGNYTSYTLGNGLVGSNVYNNYGMLQKTKVGNIFELDFVFDPVTGNLNSRKDVNKNLLETFNYDDLNRLTEMTFNGSTKTIGYAANGNKTSETEIGLSDYNTVQLHQQTNIAPFGNLVRTAPLQTINYTKFDRTLDITEGDYKLTLDYGPAKNRKKTVLEYQNNVVKTRYFSGNYEKTIDANGNTQEVHYIACGNGVTVAYVIDGSTSSYHYLHTDYLGSILAVSDANGNLEYEQNFDAWGRDRNPADWTYTTSTTTRPTWLYRGFTGHEHLREFTLINMNARMYDPEVGRMLAVDNFIANPNSSQDYNRYTYANNNPLMYADPSGEIAVVAAVALGAVVGAYLGGASANSTFNIAKWENNSTTWIGIGTGALMGGLTGSLANAGQLGFAAGVSVAGVTVGQMALTPTNTSYTFSASTAGQSFELGSWEKSTYKQERENWEYLQRDLSLLESYNGMEKGALRWESYMISMEPSHLIAIEYVDYDEYGNVIRTPVGSKKPKPMTPLERLKLGLDATGLPISLMSTLFDYAGDVKITDYADRIGNAVGIIPLGMDMCELYKHPDKPSSYINVIYSGGTMIMKMNPTIRGTVLLIDGVTLMLDATGRKGPLDYLDEAMDRITW